MTTSLHKRDYSVIVAFLFVGKLLLHIVIDVIVNPCWARWHYGLCNPVPTFRDYIFYFLALLPPLIYVVMSDNYVTWENVILKGTTTLWK